MIKHNAARGESLFVVRKETTEVYNLIIIDLLREVDKTLYSSVDETKTAQVKRILKACYGAFLSYIEFYKPTRFSLISCL